MLPVKKLYYSDHDKMMMKYEGLQRKLQAESYKHKLFQQAQKHFKFDELCQVT